MVIVGNQFEIETEIKLSLHFTGRTDGHSDETRKITPSPSSCSFGDIGWYGHDRSPELTGQAKTFLKWEANSDTIDVEYKDPASMPDIQSTVIVHVL